MLLALSSFITWRAFKRLEPDKPLPVALLLLPVPCFLSTLGPSQSLPATVGTFGIFYVSILAWTVAYRLSPWHPLAQFPGPKVCRVSKAVLAWQAYKGDLHRYVRGLHEAYGDMVRIGWYNRVTPGTPTSLVSIRDPIVHKSRRRVWDRAFSPATIRDHWKGHVMKRVGQLVDHFGRIAQQKERGGKAVVDLNNWMTSFTYDVMGDVTFGGGFEMMKAGGDRTGMTEALQGYNIMHAALAHIPWAHTYVRLLPLAAAAGKRFASIALAPLMTRITEGTQVKDLFWFVADEESPTPPSRATVKADGIMAVVAGSDTTATTLTAIWYFLLRNPIIMQLLEEEVDAHFADGIEQWGDEAMRKMSGMVRLNAIMSVRSPPSMNTEDLLELS
ncbi:hypothetical protein HWV62_15681 [Athelia sp. TMB]|nr:hypothetical protein HWV62_15681 [Athelia sp. TMB]